MRRDLQIKPTGPLGAVTPAPGSPAPKDIRKAIQFLRGEFGRKISMTDLATHCSVAERTLTKHFSQFMGISPLRYLRRLRLAAVRECLLADTKCPSITEAARTYGFRHFGRFSAQYRQCFGEAPSATLRRARIANASGQERSASDGDIRDAPLRAFSLREKPSIVVMIGRASSRDLAHRCFAESLAEGTTAALSSIRFLAVLLPRSPQAAVSDPHRSVHQLGARYLLTISILSTRVQLRVVVLLAESTTGRHIWGDSYDGVADDLLSLQERVIESVVCAILPSIRGAEIDRARRARPQDLDAYGLAMRALPFVFASQTDTTRRALELLDRAMEIDPDYGLVVALAAWCHGQLVMYNGTGSPAEEQGLALRLARRAAILDTDDPLVLTARCAVHIMAREFETADALLARALARDPTSGWAWGRSGWLHSYLGRPETAIEHFAHAISLEHCASKANSFVGIGSAHFDAGQYEAAAYWMRKALIEQPDILWANRTLSVSYARLGERLRALESLEALRRYCPDLTVRQVVAAIPFRSDYLDRLGDGLAALGLPD